MKWMHIRSSVISAVAIPLSAICVPSAWGATAQIHGQAAVVGVIQSNLTARKRSYEGIRFPFSLTLEGKPSSRVSLFLQLSPSFNLYPETATALGNSGDADLTQKQKGGETQQPLSGSFRPAEILRTSYAYLTYASDIGVLTLGRAPRHWGLGIWRNAEWRPEGGAISTADLVGLTLDFSNTLSGSLSYEKVNEGELSASGDDADAFTVEALLADDPRDPNASGLTKRIGVAFQSYNHARTDTDLSILDMFGQLYFSRFLLEGEITYPTGSTRSTGYGLLGGDTSPCADARNPDGLDVGCEKKQVEAFLAIVRSRFLISGGEAVGSQSWSSLASIDEARRYSPTRLSPDVMEIGIEGGFARGDSDSFKPDEKDNTITGAAFHPNHRPSLLMFGEGQPLVIGMPGPLVTNTAYGKLNFTSETSGFGLISVSWISAFLQKTAPDELEGSPGQESTLGHEVNIDYGYRTASKINFGITAGALFAGGAYTIKEDDKSIRAPIAYGIRSTISTRF